MLGDEKIIKDFERIVLAQSIPRFLKGIMSKIFHFFGEYRKSIVIKTVGNPSIKDFHLNSFERMKLTEKMIKYVLDNEFDAILSPCYPIPVLKHGAFNPCSTHAFYPAIWNFYDFPTFLIPRVHLAESEDIKPEDYVDTGMMSSKHKS